MVVLEAQNTTDTKVQQLERSSRRRRLGFVFRFFSDCSEELRIKIKMRPVFVGNFEYETRQSDLERLFDKYGRVDRVDMKSGKVSSKLYAGEILLFVRLEFEFVFWLINHLCLGLVSA
jgi:RNA recognition motif-containing protein